MLQDQLRAIADALGALEPAKAVGELSRLLECGHDVTQRICMLQLHAEDPHGALWLADHNPHSTRLIPASLMTSITSAQSVR